VSRSYPWLVQGPKERCRVQLLNSTPYGVRFLSAAEGEKLPIFNNLPLIWTHLLRPKYVFPPVTFTPFSSPRFSFYGDHFYHTPSSVPRLRMRGDSPPLPHTFLLSGAYVSIGGPLYFRQWRFYMAGLTRLWHASPGRERRFSWHVSFTVFEVFILCK